MPGEPPVTRATLPESFLVIGFVHCLEFPMHFGYASRCGIEIETIETHCFLFCLKGDRPMAKLPDFEALAIFAKVVELRSFAAASTELSLSKATVSKAGSRLEERLGARLFNRTSRRVALADSRAKLAERAARLLSGGEGGE